MIVRNCFDFTSGLHSDKAAFYGCLLFTGLALFTSSFALYWAYGYHFIESPLHHYLSPSKILCGNAALLSLPLLIGLCNAKNSPRGKPIAVIILGAACALGLYLYHQAVSEPEDDAPKPYSTFTAPVSLAAASQVFARTGYRIPVSLPMCPPGDKALETDETTTQLRALVQTGAVEHEKRPSLITGATLDIFRPAAALWPDYDPVLGLRFANVKLDRLDTWQYAEPVSSHYARFTVHSRSSSTTKAVNVFYRTGDEPCRYTGQWTIGPFRPWAEDEAVQRLFPQIRATLDARPEDERTCVMSAHGAFVYLRQTDPIAPMPYLATPAFVDTAVYNDPDLNRPSSIRMKSGDGTYKPLRTRRIMNEKARLFAALSQRILAPEHKEFVAGALNDYLERYCGFARAVPGSEEADRLARLTRNTTAPAVETHPEAVMPLIEDPALPRSCGKEDACFRLVLLRVSEMIDISRVYETTRADHWGYCQVRFRCKAEWTAPQAVLAACPGFAELMRTLEEREFVWTVRLNGRGWNTGVREYGTSYTVVHDARTGSGM